MGGGGGGGRGKAECTHVMHYINYVKIMNPYNPFVFKLTEYTGPSTCKIHYATFSQSIAHFRNLSGRNSVRQIKIRLHRLILVNFRSQVYTTRKTEELYKSFCL